MFQMIQDELFQSVRKIGTEALLALSPVYILEAEANGILDELNRAGDALLQSLEQADIFEDFQDTFLTLHMLPGFKLSENVTFAIGLSDTYGIIKHTLREWIESLSIELHVTKGIILICTEDYSYLEKNKVWWNSLLQTMEMYKDSFLFLITASPSSISDLEKDVCKFHYCRKFKENSVPTETLTKLFTNKLTEYHLYLSPDCLAFVEDVIEKHKEQITISQISHWAQKTAWEYLMQYDDGIRESDQDDVINIEDIDTDYLSSHTSDRMGASPKNTIGF